MISSKPISPASQIDTHSSFGNITVRIKRVSASLRPRGLPGGESLGAARRMVRSILFSRPARIGGSSDGDRLEPSPAKLSRPIHRRAGVSFDQDRTEYPGRGSIGAKWTDQLSARPMRTRNALTARRRLDRAPGEVERLDAISDRIRPSANLLRASANLPIAHRSGASHDQQNRPRRVRVDTGHTGYSYSAPRRPSLTPLGDKSQTGTGDRPRPIAAIAAPRQRDTVRIDQHAEPGSPSGKRPGDLPSTGAPARHSRNGVLAAPAPGLMRIEAQLMKPGSIAGPARERRQPGLNGSRLPRRLVPSGLDLARTERRDATSPPVTVAARKGIVREHLNPAQVQVSEPATRLASAANLGGGASLATSGNHRLRGGDAYPPTGIARPLAPPAPMSQPPLMRTQRRADASMTSPIVVHYSPQFTINSVPRNEHGHIERNVQDILTRHSRSLVDQLRRELARRERASFENRPEFSELLAGR